jgi:hypothetical protein
VDPAVSWYLPCRAKVVGNLMGDYRNDRFILVVQEVRLKLAARVSIPKPYLCRVPRGGDDRRIDTEQA